MSVRPLRNRERTCDACSEVHYGNMHHDKRISATCELPSKKKVTHTFHETCCFKLKDHECIAFERDMEGDKGDTPCQGKVTSVNGMTTKEFLIQDKQREDRECGISQNNDDYEYIV